MGFLQNLAKRAEDALAGLSTKTDGTVPSITISYLGQTASIPVNELEQGATVKTVIDTLGGDVGLSSENVNLSSIGVRRNGSVVSLHEAATEGTYFLTLAREEKANS